MTFEFNSPKTVIFNNLFNWICFFHIFIEFLLELNFGKPNENESFIESIYKRIESSTFGLFWLLFGNFSDSTSINYSLTIELNNPLNWITVWNKFWLNNIESNIEFVNFWIVLGFDHSYTLHIFIWKFRQNDIYFTRCVESYGDYMDII